MRRLLHPGCSWPSCLRCGYALQVVWRQHPALANNSSLWRVQQIAMHQALSTILAAQGFLLSEAKAPDQAPTVLGPVIPASR